MSWIFLVIFLVLMEFRQAKVALMFLISPLTDLHPWLALHPLDSGAARHPKQLMLWNFSLLMARSNLFW
jgi:hypothetical protein